MSIISRHWTFRNEMPREEANEVYADTDKISYMISTRKRGYVVFKTPRRKGGVARILDNANVRKLNMKRIKRQTLIAWVVASGEFSEYGTIQLTGAEATRARWAKIRSAKLEPVDLNVEIPANPTILLEEEEMIIIE